MTSISTGRPLLNGKNPTNLAGIEMLPTAEDTANCPLPDRHPHRSSHQHQSLQARDLQEGCFPPVFYSSLLLYLYFPITPSPQSGLKSAFTVTIKITTQISVKPKSFHTLVKSKQRSAPQKLLCKRAKKKKKKATGF